MFINKFYFLQRNISEFQEFNTFCTISLSREEEDEKIREEMRMIRERGGKAAITAPPSEKTSPKEEADHKSLKENMEEVSNNLTN